MTTSTRLRKTWRNHQWTPGKILALRDSIEKWRRIAYADGCDDGISDCPCCRMFRGDYPETRCQECPITLVSGRLMCYNTPYYDLWMPATEDRMAHRRSVALSREPLAAHRAAVAELKFLRRVLACGIPKPDETPVKKRGG